MVFAWQRCGQLDSAELLPAPPGSGPWGRVQPALPELLADQLGLHHSGTHTTGWLSPCLPNESCKSRKSVSPMQTLRFVLLLEAFTLTSVGLIASLSPYERSFVLAALQSAHVLQLTEDFLSDELIQLKFCPLKGKSTTVHVDVQSMLMATVVN